MGADMIGYFIHLPNNKQKLNSVFNEHMKNLKKAKTLKDFKDLGVNSEEISFEDDLDGLDEEEMAKYISDLVNDFTIDDIVSIYNCRDVGTCQIKVNKTPVNVIFTGDMSWGNEPEGCGYQTAKLMDRLGFISKFYDSIPWEVK